MSNYRLNIFNAMLLTGVYKAVGNLYKVDVKQQVNDIIVQFESQKTGRITCIHFNLNTIKHGIELDPVENLADYYVREAVEQITECEKDDYGSE